MGIKAISEYEGDIVALANRLRELPIGGIVTYAELDAAIGRDSRARRYLLMSARDRVEAETGALFQAVFNTGLKRLEVESFPSIGQQSRKSIRTKARNASKRMANGLDRANDVPAETVRAINREQSVLGLVQFAVRDQTLSEMLGREPLHSPTPLATAAKALMAALGVKLE
jgi:hypothetical protein